MFAFDEVPIYWANRLGFAVRAELAARFKEAGFSVTPKEWAILLLLWRDEELSVGAIADVTFRDKTTVSRMVERMVTKGLVERKTDPADRRKTILLPTAKALELQDELVPIARELVSEAQRGISAKEVQRVAQTLRTMTENLLPPGRD